MNTWKVALKSTAKMLVLTLLAGISAGIAAILFRHMIHGIHTFLFLGKWSFHFNQNLHLAKSIFGIGIILIPVLVSFLVTWLVTTFAPEAKGSGIPAVMGAIHYQNGLIRPMVALIKFFSAALSIGSGGSVGREGPIVQISAALGSLLGRRFLTTEELLILVAAAGAGGIAATFNTPLSSLLFAVELMLISISARSLFYVSFCILIACYISQLYTGNFPAIFILDAYLMHNSVESYGSIIAIIVLGCFVGLFSNVFIQTIYWVEDCLSKWINSIYFQHALGMLPTGILLYLIMHYTGHYYIDSVSYAGLADILSRTLTNPGLLFLLFLAKYVSTVFSLGSGAAGGVFSPALFMGASIGSAFANIANLLFPNIGLDPAIFALAGMAAMVSGITGACLTAIFMVMELTHNYNAPLFISTASALSYFVRKSLLNENIYTLSFLRRGKILPEGLLSNLPKQD